MQQCTACRSPKYVPLELKEIHAEWFMVALELCGWVVVYLLWPLAAPIIDVVDWLCRDRERYAPDPNRWQECIWSVVGGALAILGLLVFCGSQNFSPLARVTLGIGYSVGFVVQFHFLFGLDAIKGKRIVPYLVWPAFTLPMLVEARKEPLRTTAIGRCDYAVALLSGGAGAWLCF